MTTTHQTGTLALYEPQKWGLSHASLDRYGRIALYKQKHHLFGGGFGNFVFVSAWNHSSDTNTLPSVERIGAMSIIHSYAKNGNSLPQTLPLDKAFKQAVACYPKPYISGSQRMDVTLCDDTVEEMEVPHTWQLVDAIGASFRTPDREGQLVLQECRPGCETPFNHWGYMVPQEEVAK